ncbi:dienelactone hydrolase family protein [Clostridioides sp. ZZV14-6153]|uniref:dienelactone hydrolase family protein n=1 Tax=Clostridioides sp. ZZV14-6153 TaxID=2811494 RepID=UPI001D13069C|nr:dienelactone hydrolase family protein [Clostridioides sp. ZZV14-6153]
MVDKLIKYTHKSKIAIVVLHEIYGIDNFIKDICQKYYQDGYDVFCPELLGSGKVFSYLKAQDAYNFFITNIGFNIYEKVEKLINDLKLKYKHVLVIGYSVGATIAWRCSENSLCDGIICCYGSRIRDYIDVIPKCPVLLVFAKYDSFDVDFVASQLVKKQNIQIEIAEANHGFIDTYSKNYSNTHAQTFNLQQMEFLSKHSS